jgi:phosphatidylglycerophosphate synthase
MMISALMLHDSPVELWGLSSKQRLQRQIREMGGIDWLETMTDLPPGGMVLLLDGNYLFEIRTLRNLLERSDSILHCASDGQPAAAFVSADHARQAAAYMDPDSEDGFGGIPSPLKRVEISDLEAFDQKLRFARPPLLEHITGDKATDLENLLYGNSYRGITDLVTKFVWPKPARRVVSLCARLGMSPNMVTTIGFILMLAACYLFFRGYYFSGLLAGWVMTFLDTVDGKLARVTIQSSRFGDFYDHAIDLIHPPFWYIYWGFSLHDFQPVLGFNLHQMGWIIVIAYISSRVIEGVFPFLGGPSVFTWRPFDAWFRLVIARRNPCLIILTVSALIGQPDWGYIGVVGWLVTCTAVEFVRLLQGLYARITQGPLTSWLSADDVANGPHKKSFKVFAGTWGAYGG